MKKTGVPGMITMNFKFVDDRTERSKTGSKNIELGIVVLGDLN